VTGAWATPFEQWLWQRRAAAELAVILAAHRDLPTITWTVAPAGCTLIGQISSLAGPGQVRATFHEWRAALSLDDEHREPVSDGGTVYLRAMSRRGGVRVRLTATVFNDEPVAT
jgi:hypothetical protein